MIRHDLNGQDLIEYTDPDGKRVFVEFVDLVKRQGAGYMQYMWQWKDKEDRILPKLSYVKGFQPWAGSSEPAFTSMMSRRKSEN